MITHYTSCQQCRTVSNSVNSVNSVNSFNSVNSVNNVNSVNSYNAVLPPSPMVFLYSLKQLIESSLILFRSFLENMMRHCYLNSYSAQLCTLPFSRMVGELNCLKQCNENVKCREVVNLCIRNLIE